MSSINWFSTSNIAIDQPYSPDPLSIAPGECAAIVGTTGAGKSHLSLVYCYRLPELPTSQFTQIFYWSGSTPASDSIDDPIVGRVFPRTFPAAFKRVDISDVRHIRDELSREYAALEKETAYLARCAEIGRDPRADEIPTITQLRRAGLPTDRQPARLLIIDDFVGCERRVRSELFQLPRVTRKYRMRIIFICHTLSQLPTAMRCHLKQWCVFRGASRYQLQTLQAAGIVPCADLTRLIAEYSRITEAGGLEGFVRFANGEMYRAWDTTPIHIAAQPRLIRH